MCYVLSPDSGYQSDLFLFPVREFRRIIKAAPIAGGKHRVYLSRAAADPGRWFLRRQTRFDQIDETSCLDVWSFRRAFHLLDRGRLAKG